LPVADRRSFDFTPIGGGYVLAAAGAWVAADFASSRPGASRGRPARDGVRAHHDRAARGGCERRSPAVVNSTGAPVTLRATGTAIALDDDLRLIAEDLP
jgi:hypothetical protein